MGPTLGSFIYSLVGYMYSFVIFGILIFASTIPIYFLIPSDIDKGEATKKERAESKVNKLLEKIDEEDDSHKAPVDLIQTRGLKYSMFLTNYQSLITLIACALILFIVYFLDTILAVHLQDDFGLTGSNVGYVYIPSMGSFLIMCPIVA